MNKETLDKANKLQNSIEYKKRCLEKMNFGDQITIVVLNSKTENSEYIDFEDDDIFQQKLRKFIRDYLILKINLDEQKFEKL
ncbi:MAG: hypothetical protein II956_14045 [Bacteroidales bacterium]|nr:hypothetical protein [Bacteroidales bacterium]